VNDGDFEGAGGEDPDGTIGSEESFVLDDTAEAGLETAEKKDLSAASFGSVSGGVDAPERLEGIANHADSRCSGGAENRAQNMREHVQMLVRVDMGEAQAIALKKGDLGGDFDFDLGTAYAGCVEALEKCAEGWIERAGTAIDK